MTGLSSPDVVLAVIAFGSFALALAATAVMLAARVSRRRAARGALATARVPDVAAAMDGEPYRGLQRHLAQAMKAGRR